MSNNRLRHATSGRWTLGLILSFVTMLAWATLPIALTIALNDLDPWTLTWFRFLVAAIVMGAWMGRRGAFTGFRGHRRGTWAILLLAAAALTSNYILYLIGLERTTPGVAQIVIQLAPMLMALGGIVVFGERYSFSQWTGFAVLAAGLLLFFHSQLSAVAAGAGQLWQGAILVFLAGVGWATYALAQKYLLLSFSSGRTMLSIYVFATIVLLPATTPSSLGWLTGVSWLVVGYCAANTLIAYGSFAEALNHWEASRVGAVLALTPLGTLALAGVLTHYWPGLLPSEHIDGWALLGAGLVVGGSMTTSLTGNRT